jgi:ubiquitin-like protein Pup
MAGVPMSEKQKRERVTYTRPKDRSQQYEYGEKEAVKDQEEARRKQLKELADTAINHSDELLDEIDGLLEENALDFVNQFVQKGGQ